MSATSRLSIANAITSDPVSVSDFIPGSGNIFPKMPQAITKTAWELWYFDAVASDGTTALAVAFFRDSLGVTKGGFRVQVHVLWRDGTPHSSEFYFPDSVVTEDEGRVKGKWEVQTTDESREASFEIAPDLSTANLSFKDPKAVVGSIKLTRINDATILPNTEDEIEFGVGVNYIRPMAITTATAILDIFIPSQQPLVPVQRRQFSLGETDEAIGGMDRFWTQFSWPQIMTESYHLRAGAGPYRLHVLRIISTAAMGEKIYGSARLYRDNRTVCSAQQATDDDSMTGGGDYFVVTKLYEQGKCSVQGGFRDPNIGYRIEFVHQRSNCEVE